MHIADWCAVSVPRIKIVLVVRTEAVKSTAGVRIRTVVKKKA